MNNNVLTLPVSSKGNLKTMNYVNPSEVMKDFLRNQFRPGIVKMTCEIGDKVLLTGRDVCPIEGAFAVGMVGVVTDILEPVNGRAFYEVDWKMGPLEIDPDYTCVQGGYISLDDRAEILAQLI